MKHAFAIAVTALLYATAFAALFGLAQTHALGAEPANGAQTCGRDGSVMQYDADLHAWHRTVEPCDSDPQQKLLDAYRVDSPYNGEERCGPDGSIWRYDADNRVWVQTVAPCQ